MFTVSLPHGLAQSVQPAGFKIALHYPCTSAGWCVGMFGRPHLSHVCKIAELLS